MNQIYVQNRKNTLIIGKIYQSNNYGNFVVTKYNNYNNVEIEFLATGYKAMVASGNIRLGTIKDKLRPSVFGVGYLGVGVHISHIKIKPTMQYIAWQGMLRRCYDSKYQAKKPTYKDCSVVKEWHNFQNFAEWYEKNYPTDSKQYQLDKDKLIKGNKVYNPDACCFLTPVENTTVSQARDFTLISPDGVVHKGFNVSAFAREHGLHGGHLASVLTGKLPHHKKWTTPVRQSLT